MTAIYYLSLIFLVCTHPPASTGTPTDSTTDTNQQQHVDRFVSDLASTNEQEIEAFLDKLEAMHFGRAEQTLRPVDNSPAPNDTPNASDKDVQDFLDKLDSVNSEDGNDILTTRPQPTSQTPSEQTNQDIVNFLERLDKLSSETVNDTKFNTTHNESSQDSANQDILNFIKKLDEASSENSQASVATNVVDQFDDSTTTATSSIRSVATDGPTIMAKFDHSKPALTSSAAELDTVGTDPITSSTTDATMVASRDDQVVSQTSQTEGTGSSRSYYTPILIAICIFAVLVVLFIAVWMWKCSNRGSKDMSLNKDFNRWDPQLLRPTKADIDAFMFGSPLPSVSEMIKQSPPAAIVRGGGSVTGSEYETHIQM